MKEKDIIRAAAAQMPSFERVFFYLKVFNFRVSIRKSRSYIVKFSVRYWNPFSWILCIISMLIAIYYAMESVNKGIEYEVNDNIWKN